MEWERYNYWCAVCGRLCDTQELADQCADIDRRVARLFDDPPE